MGDPEYAKIQCPSHCNSFSFIRGKRNFKKIIIIFNVPKKIITNKT